MRKSALALLILLAGLNPFAHYTPGQAHPSLQTTAQTIVDKTREMNKYEGYFEFYHDEKQDKVWLVIDKLDQEFLYISSLSAGVGSNDIGLDRGQLGGSHVVFFSRAGDKILMTEPNYKYRAISNNKHEIRAVKDAFASSVLWGFKIEIVENGRFLVDATDFFIRDAHNVVGKLKTTGQGTYVLDKSKSAFYLGRTRNFPLNAEFEAILTFSGTPTDAFIRSVTPTPTNITVRQHHSLVQLPDDHYQPRVFDPRAGYFSISYYDFATPIAEPIVKRLISRHRLEKKDPTAAISEPVKPIVYYLDRGAPEPIRSALLEGASWWNQAFEAIGYKNAFQVKMLPEDADPMDLRYNVINWVHRSTRGWSYGSSVTDPRTGEIIKGHVTLGSLRVRQDFLIAEGLLAPYENGEVVPPEMEAMALARLRQLSAHEVGHTIGLAHSYSSSTEERASVMDYPHPQATIKRRKIDLSNAYDDKIGEWDKVSIAYGYQDFPVGSNEKAALNKILEEANERGLSFLSDQDARPAGSAHPTAHLWDNGSDVVKELDEVMKVRALALKNFGENNIRNGVPFAHLEEVLAPVYFYHRYQTEAAVKVIGGLNYRYALRGDNQIITEKVPAAEQYKALNAVLATLSAQELTLPDALLEKIPPRALGEQRNRETVKVKTGITFDPLAAAESAAGFTLSLLLHPERLARMVEYHARDNRQPGPGEVIDQLLEKTWKSIRQENLKAEVQRTVEQAVLHQLFTLATNSHATVQTRAIALVKIYDLEAWLDKKVNTETNTDMKAHYLYAREQVSMFKENPERYITTTPLNLPDGSPIGMEGACSWQ